MKTRGDKSDEKKQDCIWTTRIIDIHMGGLSLIMSHMHCAPHILEILFDMIVDRITYVKKVVRDSISNCTELTVCKRV